MPSAPPVNLSWKLKNPINTPTVMDDKNSLRLNSSIRILVTVKAIAVIRPNSQIKSLTSRSLISAIDADIRIRNVKQKIKYCRI